MSMHNAETTEICSRPLLTNKQGTGETPFRKRGGYQLSRRRMRPCIQATAKVQRDEEIVQMLLNKGTNITLKVAHIAMILGLLNLRNVMRLLGYCWSEERTSTHTGGR